MATANFCHKLDNAIHNDEMAAIADAIPGFRWRRLPKSGWYARGRRRGSDFYLLVCRDTYWDNNKRIDGWKLSCYYPSKYGEEVHRFNGNTLRDLLANAVAKLKASPAYFLGFLTPRTEDYGLKLGAK